MGGYVQMEKKNLEDLLIGEEIDSEGALPVFSSSVQIFAYIIHKKMYCIDDRVDLLPTPFSLALIQSNN